MRVGVLHFASDYRIDIAELARALEERDFGSRHAPEHTHIPTNRRTPFPDLGRDEIMQLLDRYERLVPP